MDMDDPWGSPWADEVQSKHSIISQENDTRQETTVKAASLALEEKTTSPWGNGGSEGFENWSATSVEEGKVLGFDGSSGGWERNIGGNADSAKHEGLSTFWTIETAKSDALRLAPSPLAKHTVLRGSPDPWATEFTLNETEVGPQTVKAEQQDVVGDSSPDFDVKGAGRILPTDTITPSGRGKLQLELPDEAATEIVAGEDEEKIAWEPQTPEPPSTLAKPDRSYDNQEIDPLSSRPSSSHSDGSHHVGGVRDSSRTSSDDELKRPQMPRKVSSKIQELVEHFDGLGKQVNVTESTPRHKDSETRLEDLEESDDDIDEFGDFIEGHSEDDKEVIKTEGETSDSISLGEELEIILPPNATTPAPSPVPIAIRKEFYGPVDIKVDFSVLDMLFPGIEANELGEPVFIPDTIPDNSFSNAEQRKTWYRISRYGPMRKHDTGDDENYVRVNWTQSQFRQDTLKVVARWMEEDRISGQVVLGAGGKTSSLFGWNDPKATPVPLSSAFSPKSGHKSSKHVADTTPQLPREWPNGLVRAPSSPKSASTSKSRRRSSAKSVKVSEDATPQPQMAATKFGWSSAPNDKPKPVPQVPSPETRGPNSENMLPASSPSSRSRGSAPSIEMRTSSDIVKPGPAKFSTIIGHDMSSTASKSLAQGPPLNLFTHSLSNDDDDWGEMVSSPIVSFLPKTKPLKTPRHKKSQSLGGVFQPQTSSPRTTSPIMADMSFGRIHRPTMSFDDILVPQNQSPVWSNVRRVDMPDAMIMASPIASAPASSAEQDMGTNDIPISSATDPWDLSFFDSGLAPPSKPTSVPRSKTTPKSISFNDSVSVQPPRRHQKPKEEIKQDQIVEGIVKGLPDLSYMLKR